MKLFYDGVNINKYGTFPYIEGFTTNTSFMAQGNINNYRKFYEENKTTVNNRPISLQVFDDTDENIIKNAIILNSYGTNVYVKIPIIKTNGNTNLPVICKLLQQGVKINITAIFTIEQCLNIYNIFKDFYNSINTPCIVSIFAGRISDTGVNPFEIIKFGCTLFSLFPKIEVLWAGCKEVCSVQNAIDSGCHIITIPDSILDKFSRKGKDLLTFSTETVISFHKDGVESNIIIE